MKAWLMLSSGSHALAGHAHVTHGGRNRASVTDAFEQLDLAGADPRAGFKNDADPERRHAGTVPCARFQRSFSVRDARPGSSAQSADCFHRHDP